LTAPPRRETGKDFLDIKILFPQGDVPRQQLHRAESRPETHLARRLFRHFDDQFLPVGDVRLLRIGLHFGEVIQSLDLGFAGFFADRVKDLAGRQIDFPPDHLVLGDGVSLDLDLVHVKLLPLLDAEVHVDHPRLHVGLEPGLNPRLAEPAAPVFVLQRLHRGLQAIHRVNFARLQSVRLDHLQLHLVEDLLELGFRSLQLVLQIVRRKEGVPVHRQVADAVLPTLLDPVGEDQILRGNVVRIEILGRNLVAFRLVRLRLLIPGIAGQVDGAGHRHVDIALVQVVVFQPRNVVLHPVLLVPVRFAEQLPPRPRLQLDHLLQLLGRNLLISDKTDFGDETADPLVDLKRDLRLPALHGRGHRIDFHILVAFIAVKILHRHRVPPQPLLRKNVSCFRHGFFFLEGVRQGLRALFFVRRQRLVLQVQQILRIHRQLLIQAAVRSFPLHLHRRNPDLGIHQDGKAYPPLPVLGPYLGGDDLHVAVVPRRIKTLDIPVHGLLGVETALGTAHVLPDLVLVDRHVLPPRGKLDFQDLDLARIGGPIRGRGGRNIRLGPGLARLGLSFRLRLLGHEEMGTQADDPQGP